MKSEIRSPKSAIRRRSSRRGVLLLVVLSLLVLFMLIGTAFLMSSNQYRHSATASAKLDRLGNYPTKLLDRAVMQVIRDTGEPDSAVRYHSLLRDLYGSDGFQAVVYSPLDEYIDLSFPTDASKVRAQFTRYAAPTYGPMPSPLLGPTQGQLIDIYVRQLAFSADDPLTPNPPLNEASPALLERDARHVIQLERGVTGLTQQHDLPLTKGYYNGCLLTVTAGPASGQSTRIVDYEYIADIDPALSSPPPVRQTRLFRFRVMAFPRSDGNPLKVVPIGDDREGEISDLAGATFIVNGRPFNGTGAGFNELAAAGQPRLNAVETVGIMSDKTKWLYSEIALTPNATYFFPSDPATSVADEFGARYFDPTKTPPDQYPALNPKNIAIANRPLLWKYQTFVGPGDADESYDAPDFQNMALALQTVTPRSRGRVVQGSDPSNPVTLEVDDPGIIRSQFLRLDLEDLPLPSYFRPDLENYWFHRLLNEPFLVEAIPDVNERVRAILGDPTYVFSDPRVAGQIVALKRKISLRPLREDHPNFDGSNPASRPPELDGETGLVRNGNIALPIWEAVGPWDVDNDNDGVPDSVWVDLGDPVAQAEDGTLYKPLYSFLIVDLDSRLNVNAHGLVDDITPRQFFGDTIDNDGDGTIDEAGEPGDAASPMANFADSDILASGAGYGPAEISLRPLFSPNLPGNTDATLAARIGNPAYDDYARILIGRPAFGEQPTVWGRHGSVNVRGDATINWTINADAAFEAGKVRPGIPYDITSAATQAASLDKLTMFKFFGYPWWLSNYYSALPTPSAFSNPPDLMARYGLGLDHVGQPVGEPRQDAVIYGEHSLLFDSPYELNLSDPSRRDAPDPSIATTIKGSPTAAINDDAAFATADLERVLRAYDADAGALPDRLWNVVDAFDPLKMFANQPAAVLAQAQQQFSITNPGNPELLAAAQQLAGVTRRQVTTDSYDLPAPGGSILSRLVYGADGQPGIAGFDDDGNGDIDDAKELGWGNSDDWYPIMNGIRTAVAPNPPAGARLVPDHPTIVDLMMYRIQYERWKIGGPIYTVAELKTAAQYLLPPEVIAGQRMDLNRPFGDGLDNAGDGNDNNGDGRIDEASEPGDPFVNGIVDEPEEAGEPFVDHDPDGPGPLLVNGRFDAGEYFFDVIGGGAAFTNDETKYNGPRDQLWQGLTGERIGFDYTHGGDVWDGRLFDGNNDGDYDDAQDGRLRNNGIIQRQTYARQLYCLMMLLTDEEYVASQNMRPDDQGDVSFLDDRGNFDMFILHQQLALEMALKTLWESGQLNSTTNLASPAFQALLTGEITNAKQFNNQIPAYQWMLRKLTARRIAQWAINCVDFRDADSIMTPFEYDENPFDGWGCTEYDPATGQIVIDPITNLPRVFPLDGDAATNENWGADFPAPRKFDPTRPINNDWTSDDYNVANDLPPAWIDHSQPPELRIKREGATRDVVWGTERPELLITETLALHDRRATNINDLAGYPPHNLIGSPPTSPSLGNAPDYDLDQKLKPRGSLFVELYNPWSPDANRPAELYGKALPAANQPKGVMLNRLSTLGVPVFDPVSTTTILKRSPVWRMAVLYDPFTGRLSNQILHPRFPVPGSPPVASEPSVVEQAAKQTLKTDPDGYGIDLDRDAERHVYFTSGDDYATIADKTDATNPSHTNDESDLNRADDHNLRYDPVGSPSDMGDWNLSGATPDPVMTQLRVWVPPLPYRWAKAPGSGATLKPYPNARRYFIARTERTGATPNDRDVPIAPILPGRYAVVGTSGLQFEEDTPDLPNPPTPPVETIPLPTGDGELTRRFVTPISRLRTAEAAADPDQSQRTNLYQTRRIELWPNENPNAQQLVVGENGGPEFVRTNNGTITNVTDALPGPSPSNPAGDGFPDNAIIDPAVAIPVEDLNVTEPVEGYPSLLYQRLYMTNNSKVGVTPLSAPAVPKVNSQGELEFADSYDRPFDLELELTRNGTTQNYRSLHLQRLANPSLPWNPPPYDDSGKPTYLHRPWLPVNPYLTIDSQSVDVTAYNGAAESERTMLPVGPPATGPQDPVPTEDALQGNFFAPLTAEELTDAPDHVLWALIFMFKQQTLDANGVSQAPVLPQDVWKTPADLRLQIETSPNQVENDLEKLAMNKGISSADAQLRAELMKTRTDPLGREWVKQWGWHMFRRVLPDDVASGNPNTAGSFKQWLHMKSLERGSQDSVYYIRGVPYSSFYENYTGNETKAPSGWTFDPAWTPRLLWQQSRPNARLFLRNPDNLSLPAGIQEASDLKNVDSWRVLRSTTPTEALSEEEEWMTQPDDKLRRNEAVWGQLYAGTTPGPMEPRHIVDYVLEQTLGFANQSFTPEIDRNGGVEANTIMSNQKPGAPEVALSGSPRAPASTVTDPVAILYPDNKPYDIPKELLNSPRTGSLIQSLSNIANDAMDGIEEFPPEMETQSAQDRNALLQQFYERRNRLMRSTYPWLAWNDRPFVSAEDFMQVPAWSSSLMLHSYTVANPGTLNPYDGASIIDDGSIVAGGDGVRVSTLRYAAQQAPFGHLLNYFLSATMPARVTTNPIAYGGAPNYYRILDYIEVPSRYVGTDTMFSPEVFNDVPGVNDSTAAVGTDFTGFDDPRFQFQPPFNKVSRERDPGRVNLNMVTGRREPPTASTPPLIWSEVYDGIMHRYPKYDPATGQLIRADGNLLDNSGNVLQLSHFGPAWRDVVLSRRGYAQFNADRPLVYNTTDPSPVDKLATTPDTFAFGLNRDFPTVFSNPFRSAGAGDLVPLDRMVRPGVESTWLRSHPYSRANDKLLETNSYARQGNPHDAIAWGVADWDDDGNGIKDDIREAGFGDVNATDGDRLRVDDTRFKALGSNGLPIPIDPANNIYLDRGNSGIPLFSESLPEPAIDAERNPGMMYQPMTRLGNLVTTRSNVYAIWVTVGYFEVEKAPDWTETRDLDGNGNPDGPDVQRKFGGDGSGTAANPTPNDASVRARALYDRVYPEGYMLGEELGTDTGNTKRPRAFYIIDRTEPVGFKPGEDLNVERMIRVRRRIE